jgi:hypothetical protein
MENATTIQELYRQFAGKTMDTMSLWAEANQLVLRDLVELGTSAAKESVKLHSELSRTAIEAMRDGQAASLRWQSSWAEFSADPAGWYQKALAEGLTGAQQALRRFEEGAQALTRTADRVQAKAEQTGRTTQETVTATAAKVKEKYTSN